MSEIIDNSRMRKDALKHMILQLHEGEAPEAVKKQLTRLMGQVPYGFVVEVEQELISEGLPAEEVQKLCDIHSAALKGIIDLEGQPTTPPGHPVDTFKNENRALEKEIAALHEIFPEIEKLPDSHHAAETAFRLSERFNALMEVDKHYRRKENLLFPFLEKYGITGPPTVMWGKHDETRDLLKAAIEALRECSDETAESLKPIVTLVLEPAVASVAEMIFKEEQILFPMCMDTLTETEWFDIYSQSREIGYCLFAPETDWEPGALDDAAKAKKPDTRVQFPSGSMSLDEMTAVLNTLPFDLTFVDKNDEVRYFTQGKERIFDRNVAILGRKVQMCHPPSSVHVVEKIVEDFKSGKHDQAPFWITLGGKFIHIEYFAVRDSEGEYMGTLEVSQNLTGLRKLEGEQRLLSYTDDEQG
ncbi:MAG: DUF438 domain-containing protein [FCB group bacterium]|nr:DUF438 domain-containing protein [FCB group bacterium]